MYIQINIGGNQRGLKFNMAAVDEFFKNINYSALETSSVYATIYAGLIGNDIAKGVQSDFTYEQVTEWVDQMMLEDREEELKKACDMFAETQAYKKKLGQITDKIKEQNEEEKKKTESMMSS